MLVKTLKIAAIATAPLLFAGGAMAVESITVPQQLPVKHGQKAAEQVLTEELAKQGFTQVKLSENSKAIEATGTRQNQELSLAYDLKTGDLVTVNGKPRVMKTSEAQPAKPVKPATATHPEKVAATQAQKVEPVAKTAAAAKS